MLKHHNVIGRNHLPRIVIPASLIMALRVSHIHLHQLSEYRSGCTIAVLFTVKACYEVCKHWLLLSSIDIAFGLNSSISYCNSLAIYPWNKWICIRENYWQGVTRFCFCLHMLNNRLTMIPSHFYNARMLQSHNSYAHLKHLPA